MSFVIVMVVNAQSQVAPKFKHLGIKEGLPQSTINSMAQDSTGFIWFGTMGGLSRYDGYSFKTFAHAVGDSNSLPSNNIKTIEVLPDNKLLVGTSKGIAVFDPIYEQFRVVTNSIGLEINKIKVTHDGDIWVGTTKGLKRLSLAPLTLQEPGNAFAEYSNSEVYGLEEDNYGKVWICYVSNKVVCYDPHTHILSPPPYVLVKELSKPMLKVNIIKTDKSGRLWFGTFNNGIIGYDFKKEICLTTKEELKNDLRVIMIRDILFTDHYIWVAARNGLFRFSRNGDDYEVFQAEKAIPYSLSNSSISSLLQGKSGIVWVGTYLGGVNFLQKTDQAFSYFDILEPDKGLTNQIVYSPLYDSARNVLWIGTGGGGLNCYDFRTNRLTSFSVANNKDRKSIDYNYIESLCLLPDRKLLIGTLRGLFLYDPEKKRIVPQRLNSSGKGYAVFALKNDDGGTWIGTQDDIFYRDKLGYLRKNNFPQNNVYATQSKGEVSVLLKDSRDGLWVGRINGLSYKNLRTNKVVYFDNINFLKQQYINSLLEDHAGKIWIGTDENGVVVYDPATKRFTSLNLLLGLQEKQARGIVEDCNGNLWVSSINEIWKITFDSEDHAISKKYIKMDRLSADNGLRSNEFSRAAIALPDSTLFFGGYSGSVLFKPTDLLKNTFVPPVVITDFHVDNLPDARTKILKGLSTVYADNIVIPYQYAYFSFQFAALSFVNSSQNSYAYKMEGLKDDDWHYVGGNRQATYTSLAPGNYTFWVKSANNDGLWNAPHKIRVTILPPIWMTWYAYVLYVLVFLGSTLYLFSVYRRTTRLKNELHLQHLRNEMDNEFAEKKINFYTNISHEIKTPLSLILGPLGKITQSIGSHNDVNGKVTSYLSIMRRNGEKLMGLVKQLLDYRRIEAGKMELVRVQDNFSSFVSTIVDNFKFLAKEKKVDLRFATELHYLPYDFDPDKMEHILNNLLSNAIKFTPSGGRVYVSLSMQKKLDDQKQIVIVIEDNGIGIPKSHILHLFEPFHQYDKQSSNGSGIGLTYTKALVELHGGSIEVESELSSQPFQGYTTFALHFPVQYETPKMNLGVGVSPIEPSDNQPTLISLDEIFFMKNNTLVSDRQDDSLEKTILIVEDNADMQFFLNDHFSDLYKVVTAMNGEDGWRITQNIIPDLIISDLMMPGMNGIELCKLVKENESTMHIPFILLTAKDTDESKIIGFKTGADDYVCKPFNIDLLEVRVENLFAKQIRLQEHHRKIAENYILNTDKHIPNEKDEFIQKIVDFVDENILEPELNVEQLSLSLNMSRITLYRKMKALTGLTTIEFIRNIRLQKAAQLLLEGRYNVNEVCYAVGFSDTDYFRKSFKQFFGTLPSDYAATKH